MDDPDELYNPLEFARGMVSHSDRADEGADGCGRSVRGHPLAFRLASKQGVFGVPYHGYVGSKEGKDFFTYTFRATLDWTVDGQTVALEGCWRAVVSGLRLDSILNHLWMGQRASLNVGGTMHGTEPYVASISLEPVEPVGL